MNSPKKTIAIVGCGSLGSHIAESIIRGGVADLILIDHDKVKQQDLSTHPFFTSDVGAHKATSLAVHLYLASSINCKTHTCYLTADNCAELLRGADLIVNTLEDDESTSVIQEYANSKAIPIMHVKVNPSYGKYNFGYGLIMWQNPHLRPLTLSEKQKTAPRSRNLILITATISFDVILEFLETQKKEEYYIGLGDKRTISLTSIITKKPTPKRSRKTRVGSHLPIKE
jgi:hypothetical protein